MRLAQRRFPAYAVSTALAESAHCTGNALSAILVPALKPPLLNAPPGPRATAIITRLARRAIMTHGVDGVPIIKNAHLYPQMRPAIALYNFATSTAIRCSPALRAPMQGGVDGVRPVTSATAWTLPFALICWPPVPKTAQPFLTATRALTWGCLASGVGKVNPVWISRSVQPAIQ